METTRIQKRAAVCWAGGTLVVGLGLALLVLALAVGASPRMSAEQPMTLCVTPNDMVHYIVLPGLRKSAASISSRYVITNPADGPAMVLHAFCTGGHDFVTEQIDRAPIEPDDSRIYWLALIEDLPSGYQGYAVVQSDQAITGTVLPPPLTVFLPAVMRAE
jgi:hypothetical protein